MRLDEPQWWYGDAERVPWQVRALRPLGRLYGAMAERRFRNTQAYRSRLPVICAGNLTAGGTGKTPLSVMIASRLIAMGERPVFLTRGYGGRNVGPLVADREHHTARQIGDEPLLLARVAPVVVARDRKAGARLIEAMQGSATAIVMDDGLQNPALVKDLSIAVIDAVRGIGNGEVIPAGPLRAPLEFQLARVDCIIGNGPPSAATDALCRRFKQEFPGPVLCATIGPAEATGWIRGGRLVAYAGIGNPQRFFSLLESLGGSLVERITFPDHHEFSDADARRLLAAAHAGDAVLVTTEKDLARLAGARGVRGELERASRALPIVMTFEPRDEDRLIGLVEAALKTGRAGKA